MKAKKPKKRVILYWFVEYGFFFIAASLYILATFLKITTLYYNLTVYLLNLTIIVIILSLLFLIYKWLTTEYFLLKKHLFLKQGSNTTIIPYNDIKEVGYSGSLLQHLLGTTNLRIKNKKNKNFYLEGIKDYKKLEDELLSKLR